jgi:Protein of unknown function (DUF2778)
MSQNAHIDRVKAALLASAVSLLLGPADLSRAQQPAKPDAASAAAAGQLADIFGEVGDQIYADCVFELSQEQIDVQSELIKAYIEQGATSSIARHLAATQIQPPKLSQRCEQIKRAPQVPRPVVATPAPANKPSLAALPKSPDSKTAATKLPDKPAPVVALAAMKVLPQWDCAPGVDFVTIHLNGYARKLTGGEICNPYEDVVHEVPASVPTFRLGYTIKTGRLFVIADGAGAGGHTIAWGLSGRDVCRNNPDPNCFAAKAVGPLPPGEYAFASDKAQRVSFGPRTKRNVAGIYLGKLWNKDRFNPQQTAAIMGRGNIAIHMRLKGEMSEACIGLEPKGWAYVASLIKDARATGINVYIEEPYPKIAESPPVVVASSFSLTSLFK